MQRSLWTIRSTFYKNKGGFCSQETHLQKNISLLSQVLHTKRYMRIFTAYFADSVKLCFTHIFAELIVNSWSIILVNWKRFISPTYLSTITSFTFYISITDWEIQRYLWTQNLQNCWSRMHNERKQLVTKDASSSTKSWIKFEFSSFSSPIHKK